MELKAYIYHKDTGRLAISVPFFAESMNIGRFVATDYMIGELINNPPKELTEAVDQLPGKWEDTDEVYKLASDMVDKYYFMEVEEPYWAQFEKMKE